MLPLNIGSLYVRRGFLFGAAGGFFLAGSTIWALTSVPQILRPAMPDASALASGMRLPKLHADIPPHLLWFFIQYDYVSDGASIRHRDRHSAVVTDAARGKQYVLRWGQQFRRVEVYSHDQPEDALIHVLTPGYKRIVSMVKGRVTGDTTQPDGNLWMWRSPLWNETHLRIYGMADFWLNAPYKKHSCAGFVQKYLGDAGVKVPVLDAWDLAKLPYKRVSLDELEPGDILSIKAASETHRRFWGHTITHVGVYIGNGTFIHAATASRKAKRAFIRLGEIDRFKPRIAHAMRPPQLL